MRLIIMISSSNGNWVIVKQVWEGNFWAFTVKIWINLECIYSNNTMKYTIWYTVCDQLFLPFLDSTPASFYLFIYLFLK